MNATLHGRRFFYFCYDHDKPTGGQKDTYRHVDVLVRLGAEAYVFHIEDGRRLGWFENATPVVGLTEFRKLHRPDTDVVVVPEDLGPGMFELPGKKVVFNKNLYYGFTCFGDPPFSGRDPYADGDIIGVMAVSEHNWLHLRYAYPSLPIMLVTCGVPAKPFAYRPLAQKRRLIAYSAKVPGHVRTLYHMLRARSDARLNDLADVEWRKLSGLTEHQVAETLRDALAFVCLSTEEGIVRTVLEAMHSGCVICSYAHGPVAEYLPEPCQFHLGDLVTAGQWLERLTALGGSEQQYFDDVSRLCAAHAVRYGEEAEEASIVRAWSAILSGTTHSADREKELVPCHSPR